MPLALELAAGWLRVMTPDQIATQLERGLPDNAAAECA
jgi:hypothetical protein